MAPFQLQSLPQTLCTRYGVNEQCYVCVVYGSPCTLHAARALLVRLGVENNPIWYRDSGTNGEETQTSRHLVTSRKTRRKHAQGSAIRGTISNPESGPTEDQHLREILNSDLVWSFVFRIS